MTDPVITELRPWFIFKSWKSKYACYGLWATFFILLSIPFVSPKSMSPVLGLILWMLIMMPAIFLMSVAALNARKYHFEEKRISEQYYKHLIFRFWFGNVFLGSVFTVCLSVLLIGLIGFKKNVLIRAVPTPELIAQIHQASDYKVIEINDYQFDGTVQDLLIKTDERDKGLGINKHFLIENPLVTFPVYLYKDQEIKVDYTSDLKTEIYNINGRPECYYARELAQGSPYDNSQIFVEIEKINPAFPVMLYEDKLLIKPLGRLEVEPKSLKCRGIYGASKDETSMYSSFWRYQMYPHLTLKVNEIDVTWRISARDYQELNDWFGSW